RTLLPEDVTIANNIMRSAGKPIVEGRDDSGITWIGNLAQGGATGPAFEGIKLAELRLVQNDGVWRPAEDSPARRAAKSIFGITMDIERQPRPASGTDAGCDQQSRAPVLNKPLMPADVGPDWKAPDLGSAKIHPKV